MLDVAELTTVNLVGGCAEAGCLKLAGELHLKLDTPKYRLGVSLMAVPETLEDWRAEHRTARKRAYRAHRLGYHFDLLDRAQHADDIYAINTSLERRQGRPMTEGYRTRKVPGALPEYPCGMHSIQTYGVFEADQTLRAYLTLYRVNELVLVSMILGHGDHLRNDIMYLLAQGMVASQAGLGGWFYYNRHDSGTEGLRYYKERVGFSEQDVAWSM